MYFPPTASYIKKQDTTGEVGRKWHPLHWRDYGNKRGCGGGVLWHPPVDSPPNKCASWCRWIIIFQRNLAPNKDLETLSWNEKTRGRQRGDVYRARTWRSSFLTSLKESRGGGGKNTCKCIQEIWGWWSNLSGLSIISQNSLQGRKLAFLSFKTTFSSM